VIKPRIYIDNPAGVFRLVREDDERYEDAAFERPVDLSPIDYQDYLGVVQMYEAWQERLKQLALDRRQDEA
jgi:hypothetical protein